MSLFLRDLWQDLREKRLWPVAAVLALALAAVPLLLRQSGGEDGDAAPAPPAASAGAAAQAAPVVSPAVEAGAVSDLKAFESKDPFRPRGPIVDLAKAVQEAAASAPGGATATGGGSTLASGGASGGSSLSFQGGSGGSGGGSGFSSPASPPPSSGGGGEIDPPSEALYTWEIDVNFGRRGKERPREGLHQLDPIPSEKRPLLVFVGVSGIGDGAVFLVHEELEQRGEGECSPDEETCSLLTLRDDRKGDLHFFTDAEGRGYALRLTDIRLVPIDEAKEREKADEARREKRAEKSDRDEPKSTWPFRSSLFTSAVEK